MRNFRSLLDAEIACEPLTALVGANGAGKSSFLRALDLFYSSSPSVDVEDFYNSDTSQEISIGLTFSDLSAEAEELFASYLQGGKLTVERVFKWDNVKATAAYHGASLQNPDFQPIRDGLALRDRGRTARQAYDAAREKPGYSMLPEWTTIAAAGEALAEWETAHPDLCTRQRDDGQFFGFTGVGKGYLGRFTRFLFIPAVRDASGDAEEGRGSALTNLMDMVVRSVVAKRDALKTLREETQQRYEEILQPANLPELQGLEGELSRTLQTFAPNAAVDLRWLPLEPIQLDMPRADVKLVEDRFPAAVHRTGHGLQRAFILTMLQHLAMAQSARSDEELSRGDDEQLEGSNSEELTAIHLPDLVLAVEEPELYQHPNRQRHLARIFLQLARGVTPGVAKKTQVIYTTHSPLFVGLDRFDQIRLLRKVEVNSAKPKVTNVIGATLDSVATKLWKANGKQGDKFTGATLAHRLHSIMTPLTNEGFFADVVVLVEGEDDRAAILGMAAAMNTDLESRGISVIPVGGKVSLDRPALIFREFGIPVYMIWDSDGGKGETSGVCAECGRPLDSKPDPKDNHRLLRIVGRPEEDWPAQLEDGHCCFQRDLETTLKSEVGTALYEDLLAACQKEFAIPKRKHAAKNPQVIAEVIRRAADEGCECGTLRAVVERIVNLRTGKQA